MVSFCKKMIVMLMISKSCMGQNPPNLLLAAVTNDISLAERLYREGRNLNTYNINGNTPLHMAAKIGNCAIISKLLEWGADPTQANNKGQLPHERVYCVSCCEQIGRFCGCGKKAIIIRLLTQEIKERDGAIPMRLFKLTEIEAGEIRT